jgi:hypothetical protein
MHQPPDYRFLAPAGRHVSVEAASTALACIPTPDRMSPEGVQGPLQVTYGTRVLRVLTVPVLFLYKGYDTFDTGSPWRGGRGKDGKPIKRFHHGWPRGNTSMNGGVTEKEVNLAFADELG